VVILRLWNIVIEEFPNTPLILKTIRSHGAIAFAVASSGMAAHCYLVAKLDIFASYSLGNKPGF